MLSESNRLRFFRYCALLIGLAAPPVAQSVPAAPHGDMRCLACHAGSSEQIKHLFKKFPGTSSTEFHKGIAYASWWRGEFSSSQSFSTISQDIKPLGANWIQIVATCYQANIHSTVISCDSEKTPSDDDLVQVIRYAHQHGLKVMLKPHLDLSSDPAHWRGEIGFDANHSKWQAWFKGYNAFISHYASIARDELVEYLVVGTELKSTTGHTADWQAIIRNVRALYRGKITYAAHHDTELYDIKFWDEMDAMSVDAYFPLTYSGKHDQATLVNHWQPISARLLALATKWNKKIIFTEIGYQSRCGCTQTPWGAHGDDNDTEEQKTAYQAAFEALSGQPWLQGMYWWVYTVGNNASNDFSPHGKPAEDVLRKCFEMLPGPIRDDHSCFDEL